MKSRLHPIHVLVVFFFTTTLSTFSQMKNNPIMIGGRAGISNGLTVKKFLSGNIASETLLTKRFKGYHLTSLIEWHKNLGSPKYYAYFGGGAHVSLIGGKEVSWYHDEEQHIMPGIDLVFGIDYYFSKLPLNFSIDIKPSASFIGDKIKPIDGAGFSLRYYFEK